MALKECADKTNFDTSECPVLLGVREPFRIDQRSDWRSKSLLEKIHEYSGLVMHSDSQVFPEGNASFFLALKQAQKLLAENRSKFCLVGGVDSLLNHADIKRFGDSYRLISDEVAQGFVPGEGAAFIAVTRADGTGSSPRIKGVGLDREDNERTVLTDATAEGKGLEAALHAALSDARLQESIVEFRVSDLNGEMYRGQESMLALFRVYRTHRSQFPQIYPASCIGETGAAAGAFLAVVAATALIKGYAPGRVAMCEASSDAGLRGACIVSGL
jgi:3-oxoacyl-(acyl-carrier-protein) synthase